MKKSLLTLMLLCFAFIGVSSAQETIIIGDMESTQTSYNVPYNSLYGYSFTEQLYTAEEIAEAGGVAGIVETIRFYHKPSNALSAALTNNIVVYMVNTDQATFADYSNYVPVTASDIVFEGDWTIPVEEGWVDIALETPFEYEGNGIMVGVHETTSGYSSRYFLYTNISNSVCRFYSDSYNPDPYNLGSYAGSKNVTYTRANLQMDITPSSTSCIPPTSIAVSDITTNSATVTWEGEGDTWNLRYKASTAEEYTLVEGLTAYTYTFDGTLAGNTTYNVGVQTVCGDITSSFRSTTFTTANACAAPTDLQITDITDESATLTWMPGYEETEWTVKYKKSTVTSWDEASVESVFDTPTITLADLDEYTTYNVQVYNCENYVSGDFMTLMGCPDGVICIGSGIATSNYLPANNYYKYSLTEQIYTADEIGEAGAILSIAFFKKSTTEMIKDLDIYMMSTTVDAFASTADWIVPTASDLVYSGQVTFDNNAWTTIELDAPFIYDGTSNVVVLVNNKTGAYKSNTPFLVFSASEDNQSIYFYQDGSAYDPMAPTGGTSGTTTQKDQFRLVIGEPPACLKPTVVTASDVTAHEATITWTSDAAAWEIQLNDEAAIDVTEATYTFEELAPETTYSVKVRANCDGIYSDWTTALSFTTGIACTVPTSFATSDVGAHNVTLSWTSDAFEWVVAYKTAAEEEFTEVTVTENPYMLEGLAAETSYTVKVKAVCGGIDGDSQYTTTRSFTTLQACPAPSNLTVSNLTATGATLTWTELGEGTAWYICLDGDEENLIEVDETTYTFLGLEPETVHTAKVKSDCSTAWSSVVEFEPTAKWVIGSGTATNTYLPTYYYYKHSLTQQIYTVAELGEASLIESIDFYCNQNVTKSRDFNIYMVNTDKSGFESNTDWITVTAADLVYSGTLATLSQGWNTFQLDEAFIYNGTSNVAIIVDADATDYLSGPAFRVFSADSQSIRVYNDNTDYDPMNPSYTGTVLNVKNQIRILKSELGDCMKPTNLTINEIGPDFVSLSWTENGASTEWEVNYNAYLVTTNNNDNFVLENLDPETEYTITVAPTCDNLLVSAAVTFTTLAACPAPENVEVSDVTHTAANVSWTGYNDSYTVSYRVAPGLGDPVFSEDFEGGAMPDGWIVEGDNQNETKTWRVGVGDYSTSTGAHGGNYNALITHNNKNEITYLITPAIDLSGQSDLVLSFWYINRKWAGDTDGLGVYYRVDGGDWNELWSTTENHNVWTNQTIFLTGFADNYQLGFQMTDNYGYGVGLDDIVIAPEVIIDWTTINPATSPQAISGLTAGTDYQVKVQGFCGNTPGEVSEVITFTTLSEDYKIFVTEGDWNNADSWEPAGVPTIEQDVELRANVTITELAEANNITQGEYAITIEDGGQLVHNTTGLSATVKKNITGYGAGNEEAKANYYLIANPLTSNITPSEENGLLDGVFDLYDWNSLVSDGNEWINYEDTENGGFTLLSGMYGYLYANQDGTELNFTGAIRSSQTAQSRYVYNNGTSYEFGAWSLFGNPFVCNAYLVSAASDGSALPYYKMKDTGDGFEAKTGVAIAPMEGIFYQAETNSSVYMSRTAPAGKGANLNMVVSQGRGVVDNAIVSFNNTNTLEKFSFRESSKLYIPQNGKDYAVVYSESVGEMPVSFKAEKNGTYTLSFSSENVEFSYLHLIDNLTGANVDLLANPSYSFDAKNSDYASRFKLVFVVNEDNLNNNDNFAFVSNGNIIVNGEGTLQVIDMTGRVISTNTINGVSSISVDAAAGVYVLQLSNGNEVKTQKIVVK